jgi:hypothetical protein
MKPELKVRLGHALLEESATDGGALHLAIAVVEGTAALTPRPPREEAAVRSAEAIMELRAPPIYAYLGLLHKALGTVGLIIGPSWVSRSVVGVSRCDSGGLAGGFGGFCCIKDREASLKELCYLGENLSHWQSHFIDELAQSYSTADLDYVHGEVPRYEAWKDVRAASIQYAKDSKMDLDRRLWTWEAQLGGSPNPDEVECLILSPEMHKRLEVLRRGGRKVPTTVRILPGEVTSAGIHWFDSPLVQSAFLGAS